nr:hypothetical protein [Tanacetum cinerariifolium]
MTTPATVKAVKETCVIYGGAHSYYDCIATDSNISSVCASTGSGLLPSNTVPNPRTDLKAITTQSGVTLAGPLVSLPPFKEVDRELETIMDQVPEVTKKMVQPSTENIQPPVVQTHVPIYEPVVASKPKLTIPYPSRANKQKLHKKDDLLALKFLEIFKNLLFELSFADALLPCEEYVQEVLGFSNNSKSGIPTLTLDPIISSSSTSFTPFERSDFILEEIETFLQTPDELSDLDDDY